MLLAGRALLEELLERLGLLATLACAVALALSAMGAASGGGPRSGATLASLVLPAAEASDSWMDAGAGGAVGAHAALAKVPPSPVLTVASFSDGTPAGRALQIVSEGGVAVNRAIADGDAMTARVLVDQLLGSLHASVAAGTIGRTDAAPVAAQLCSLRAETVWALGAPPRGWQGSFLRRTAAAATLGDWQWGVPAAITLAQAVLESDWGRSAPGHNLFGLKGAGPAGSTVRRVVEFRHGRSMTRLDPFRAYDDEAEALADHARILGTSNAYAPARLAGDDDAAFARALVGTYASDPRYAGKLSNLVTVLRLDRFDWRASDGGVAPSETSSPVSEADPAGIGAVTTIDATWVTAAGPDLCDGARPSSAACGGANVLDR